MHKLLGELDDIYLSPHYEDPRVGGAYASEITGGGYVRQQVSLRLPSGRATWNLAPLSFVALAPT